LKCRQKKEGKEIVYSAAVSYYLKQTDKRKDFKAKCSEDSPWRQESYCVVEGQYLM